MRRMRRRTRDGVFAYCTKEGQRWGVDYRDPTTRKRKRKTGFASKELALRWKDQREREVLGLAKKPAKRVLFGDAVDRYIEFRQRQGKSIRSYYHLVITNRRGVVPGFWTEQFGDHPIGQLSAEELEDALRAVAKRRGWAPATCNRALAQLSGLFTYAVRRRWVSENPVDRGRVPRLPEDNARSRWLRLEEVEAIVDHAPGWLAAIVRFAVATGMRLGEVCQLTRAHYQVDDEGKGYVITERTKNGERLVWPLEGWVRDYVEARVRETRFAGELLFPGPKGGSPYTCIHRTLPGVVKAAGLTYGRDDPEGVTFHTFRHSMASLALNHGVGELTVQRMGNWKTRAMVARYAHLADEQLRSAASKLASLVDNRNAKNRKKTRRASATGSKTGKGCVESA